MRTQKRLFKGPENVNERGLSGGRPERWIYGVNSVFRRLEADPGSILEIQISRRDSPRLERLLERARQHGIAVRAADTDTMRRTTGSAQHQGVAARTCPFAYADLDRILAAGATSILLLDHIQDPHNFGALIRSAAAVGMTGIVIPRDGAVGVTPTVEHVASGAALDVPICVVVNLSRALQALKEAGFWIIGLGADAPQQIYSVDSPERIAIVLGGEQGLRPLIRQNCDFLVSIPMAAGVESLNAAVAGGIAMYELIARRRLVSIDRPRV